MPDLVAATSGYREAEGDTYEQDCIDYKNLREQLNAEVLREKQLRDAKNGLG